MESRIKNISIALTQTQGLGLHIPQIKGSSEKAICTAEIRFNALMKLKFVTRSGRRTIELYDAVSLEVSSTAVPGVVHKGSSSAISPPATRWGTEN